MLHWPYIGCVLLAAAISGLIFALRRRWEAGPALWLYYVVTLAPVLGLIQYGVQMVGDRYSYLSCLGWALLAGAGFGKFLSWSKSRVKNGMALSSLTLIILSLGGLTWKQTQVWHDSIRLWNQVISVEPNNDVAYGNLCMVFLKTNNFPEAMTDCKKALALNPRDPNALLNLGLVLIKIGKLKQAVAEFQRGIRIDPDFDDFHYELGKILAAEGQKGGAETKPGDKVLLDRALTQYHEISPSGPIYVKALVNAANILLKENKFAECARVSEQAISIDPKTVPAYLNWGNALILQGKIDAGIGKYREALRIDPHLIQAYSNWGLVLIHAGRLKEAVYPYQEALKLDPSSEAYRNILSVLTRRTTESSEPIGR